MTRQVMVWGALVLMVGAGGCKSAYYGAMEKVGIEKRDIMVGRVEAARDSQVAASEQFRSALDLFSDVVAFDGGKLEKTYNKLDKEFRRSQKRAVEVRDRMDSIESVSKALFKEWKSELKDYSSASLRKSSQAQLKETQRQYETMMTSMRKAAATMDPVLAAFQDQVLFLKHNLNAQAIASIQTEAAQVESDIKRLIADMEASIAEANAFIEAMGD
jgi:hypothetical protein